MTEDPFIAANITVLRTLSSFCLSRVAKLTNKPMGELHQEFIHHYTSILESLGEQSDEFEYQASRTVETIFSLASRWPDEGSN
jgi:hypothetical protein